MIRTDALRKTRLFPRYQGGDKRPLGELSLYGKFVEVPEFLLLRRFHEEASSRNNPHRPDYDRRTVRVDDGVLQGIDRCRTLLRRGASCWTT